MTSPGPLICDVNETGCEVFGMLPIIDKISWREAMPYIAFAPLTLKNGSRRAWAEHVRALGTRRIEGAYFAAAHLFGSGPHNALVEVMAEDEDLLHELLLVATDFDGVLDVRVMRCAPEDTRGMGTFVEGM